MCVCVCVCVGGGGGGKGGGYYFFCFFTFIHFLLSPLSLSFMSITISSIYLVPFSGRQNKMVAVSLNPNTSKNHFSGFIKQN